MLHRTRALVAPLPLYLGIEALLRPRLVDDGHREPGLPGAGRRPHPARARPRRHAARRRLPRRRGADRRRRRPAQPPALGRHRDRADRPRVHARGRHRLALGGARRPGRVGDRRDLRVGRARGLAGRRDLRDGRLGRLPARRPALPGDEPRRDRRQRRPGGRRRPSPARPRRRDRHGPASAPLLCCLLPENGFTPAPREEGERTHRAALRTVRARASAWCAGAGWPGPWSSRASSPAWPRRASIACTRRTSCATSACRRSAGWASSAGSPC